MKKKLCALLVAVSVLATSLPNVAFAAQKSDNDTLTRGEVVEVLLAAADSYHEGLKESDIIKGYGDGDTKENQSVSRVECLAMVSRAFGKLPEPTGNNKRLSLAYDYFVDIPQWAKDDIENLAKAGVVAGTGNHQLSPNVSVTRGQLSSFVTRIWALLGTNANDDFYNTVNKKELDNSKIEAGQASDGNFVKAADTVSDRLDNIIKDIVKKGGYKHGSAEQKISDFYKGVLDTKTRNTLGVSVVQKYIDGINGATSLAELEEVNEQIYKDTGISLLVGANVTVDSYDSDHYITTFSAVSASMPKDFYTSSDAEVKNAYLTYLSSVLQLAGDKKGAADKQAGELYNMEKALASVSLSTTDSTDIDKTYNVYTPQEMKTMFYNIDTAKVLTSQGFHIPKKILVYDVQELKAFNNYYTDQNLALLKSLDKVMLVGGFGSVLTTKYSDIFNEFAAVYYGMESDDTISDEDRAMNATESYLSDYLDKIYVDKYFSASEKANVEKMVQEFVDIFKGRIEKLTWMSQTTKAKAIKKLDTMRIKVGYSDDWDTYWDDIDVVYEPGENNYYNNICSLGTYLAKVRAYVQTQNSRVNKDSFGMAVTTVNAGYDPTENSITIPAGILQAPFYSNDAAAEENFGAIGIIIAHEITHAFDNNGARYDEKGNVANWWTSSDYQKFQELCQKVVNIYDGYEVAPGIYNNGAQTVGENIADLGGMACALEAMSRLENPDYQKFFDSYANLWCSTATRQYMQYLSQVDVHSLDKARVNRSMVNFEEFYQTYHVSENDGMYIPESERVVIW